MKNLLHIHLYNYRPYSPHRPPSAEGICRCGKIKTVYEIPLPPLMPLPDEEHKNCTTGKCVKELE